MQAPVHGCLQRQACSWGHYWTCLHRPGGVQLSCRPPSPPAAPAPLIICPMELQMGGCRQAPAAGRAVLMGMDGLGQVQVTDRRVPAPPRVRSFRDPCRDVDVLGIRERVFAVTGPRGGLGELVRQSTLRNAGYCVFFKARPFFCSQQHNACRLTSSVHAVHPWL